MSEFGILNQDNQLPGSIIAENRIKPLCAIFLAAMFFILFFSGWLIDRELSGLEGLYATCALEFIPGQPITAHGVIQRNIPPLFPALTAMLHRAGVPIELSLRLISVTMLGAWATLAGIATAKRRNVRAGAVAFLCCAGTVFAMDKGVDGLPTSTAAFFLLAGQLVFFNYGNRLANWNKAWIGSSLLWIAAYLAGGPTVLLYILVPLLFLRRPLSVRSKFNTPGFFIACTLTAIILCFRLYQGNYDLKTDFLPESFSLWDHTKQILQFPWTFPIRFFPWSLLMWLPFCAALQPVDPTPVFSKYLRTLFIVSFALAWLLPERPGRELFFAIGPLAIMIGLNYDLGIRRYWKWFRKALFPGEIFVALTALIIAALLFLPRNILELTPYIKLEMFVYPAKYKIVIFAALLLIAVQVVFFHLQRRQSPIWEMILRLGFVSAIFCNIMLLPNYVMEQRWHNLGRDIATALPPQENIAPLYKLDIRGMYCGLFYAGVPVKKIKSLEELPSNKTIYLISSGFPRHFGWRWTPLLPPDYRFEGEHLTMWRGIPVPLDELERERTPR